MQYRMVVNNYVNNDSLSKIYINFYEYRTVYFSRSDTQDIPFFPEDDSRRVSTVYPWL